MSAREDGAVPATRGLGLLWLVAALAVGAVGLLVLGLAELGTDRFAGGILLVGAAAALLAGGLCLARARTALAASFAVSVMLVLDGVVAVLALSSTSPADLLLVGGVPLVAAGATVLVAGRAAAAGRVRRRRRSV